MQLQSHYGSTLRLKCDGTRAETRFRLSAKGTSPFKSAGASVQSTTGSRGARISVSNAGHTMFRGCVKSTCYPHNSLVSPSLPLPCVTVCLHISTGLYKQTSRQMFRTFPRLFIPRKAKKPVFIISFLESHILIVEWLKWNSNANAIIQINTVSVKFHNLF